MNNKNEKKHIPFVSKTQLALCVMLCPIFIATYALLNEYTVLPSIFLAVALSFLYLSAVACVAVYHKQFIKMLPSADVEKLLSETGSSVLRNTMLPVLAIDSYGTMLWYNDAMHNITDLNGNFIGMNIASIINEPIKKENFEGKPVVLFDRQYSVESFEITSHDPGLYLIIFNDVTDFLDTKKRYQDERVAVAYIAIDNIEDILQYVHDKFKDAVADVDEKIKAWAKSMNGIVKSYDNDKYLVLFDSAKLDECIGNRFEILDEIRNSRVGDGVSITVSMGISKAVGSLADREKAAREAIDLALQRGGDQAVYKTEDSIEYYGGRTKSLYKRSNVRSRTFTNQLSALISRSDNVIVM